MSIAYIKFVHFAYTLLRQLFWALLVQFFWLKAALLFNSTLHCSTVREDFESPLCSISRQTSWCRLSKPPYHESDYKKCLYFQFAHSLDFWGVPRRNVSEDATTCVEKHANLSFKLLSQCSWHENQVVCSENILLNTKDWMQ